MSNKKQIIFPIAIDLGAKTTGVYAAGYESDILVDQFIGNDVFKTAFVADVDVTNKGYQLLQIDRTASRHGRRCRTRNRQAKKLLMLLLEHFYHFNTGKHAIAISHFMNRRGYTYIENQVDRNAVNAIDEELLREVLSNTSEDIKIAVSNTSGDITLFDKVQLISDDNQKLHGLKKDISGYIGKDQKRKKSLSPLLDCINFFINEKESGAKHRREYFKIIAKDIQNLRKHPERSCRRLFHALNDHQRKSGINMLMVFHHLVCHINNFDLKLLNEILIKVGTKTIREDIEEEISRLFGKWICKQWRTSESNGKQRITEIRELRNDWKSYQDKNPNTVISFLLGTAPELTIPPYESHTNRRPPRCQTLTFNSEYLDTNYPEWLSWLKKLEKTACKAKAADYFREQLKLVQSSKGNVLVPPKEQDTRTLQVIFDWVQDNDEFKLNTIWSKWKKWRQLHRHGLSVLSIEKELEQLVSVSSLPSDLTFNVTTDPEEKSFWHLVNSYYQIRRRAKDGRYFLHNDNTLAQSKRWQRDSKLMVMCQHRPRQLRHQLTRDICVLFGLQPQQLSHALKLTGADNVAILFAKIRGLKTRSHDCYKLQKKLGADLKERLNTDRELVQLKKQISELLLQVAALFDLNDEQTKRFCERNDSIFIFAQLYQLVWGERSGFGKTCPACSADNAARMGGYNGLPIASRLHTLSMRLIDGGLKRLLNHQAHHIANRLWPEIEKMSIAHHSTKVTIPIIIEQNRFDFTENLSIVKGQKKSEGYTEQSDLSLAKKERIKQSSKGLCPYLKGESLSDSTGDFDHIIPRSGRYGVLNDEANLIYASIRGNREIKKNRELTLGDLSPEYLQIHFGTKNVQDIESIIVNRLQGEKEGTFSFGRYSQFISLSEPLQIAFRHALFLPIDHPLRQLVIKTILHTNKNRVNGTQRYMAQLLADILVKKAEKTGLSGYLKFDYIEVSSNGNDENSTVALRRFLRRLKLGDDVDLSDFDKKSGEEQQPYSHVIDATMAFMLALDQHNGEGALRIKLDKDDSIWGYIDTETGEEYERLFSLISVPPQHLAETVNVMPQSSLNKSKQLIEGKKAHEVYSRKVFKQNAIGLAFYDLALIDDRLFKGFVNIVDGKKDFIKANEKEVDKTLDTLNFAVEHAYYQATPFAQGTLYRVNKSKLLALLFAVLSKAKDRDIFDLKSDETVLVTWLFGKTAGQLFYYTTSTGLEAAPNVIKQKSSPYQNQWLAHFEQWHQQHPETRINAGNWVISAELQADWITHCKHVLGREHCFEENEYQPVHRKQQGFTMRSLTSASGALALVRRKSKETYIYQLLAINTNDIPKEHIAALVLTSPNLVLFGKTILSKGYQYNLEEKEEVEGEFLTVEQFFNIKGCKALKLETGPLVIKVVTATSVQIKGIDKQWFSENLVLVGSDTEKQWKKLKVMQIGDIAQEEDVINKNNLKTLLKRACRTDKSFKIKVEGDTVDVILPYKTPTLRTLMKK